MSLNSEMFDYNFGKENYVLARLLITKKYIEANNIKEAVECLDDVIQDLQTDFDNPLFK